MRKRKGKSTKRKAIRVHRKVDLNVRDVDNPMFMHGHPIGQTNPRKIAASINIKESAIETLYARKAIDDAQKRTADRFRETWEAVGGAGAGAMDYSHEPVDGGGIALAITERKMQAGQDLAKCRQLLGVRNYDLVRLVCGLGYALDEVCRSKREKLTAADNLRASLDDLAVMWGYASRHLQRRAG